MPDAWDTSVASRVSGTSRHAALLAVHRRTSTPIPLPAPTIQELVRGAALTWRDGTDEGLEGFAHLLVDPLTEVVPFAGPAAQLTGWLLADLPHPPARKRQRRGTRAQARASWTLDVQIAACAFAGGYGVLTETVDDFGLLRDAIADLLPQAPSLVVRDARELAESPS